MDGTTIAQGILTTLNAEYSAIYVGNFDADTNGELILRRGGNGIDAGALFVAQFNNGSVAPPTRMLNAGGQQEPVLPQSVKIEGVADTDGDGFDDLILRNSTSIDRWKVGAMAVQSKAVVFAGTGPYWKIVGFPDLDGDRRRGVLFRGNGGETWSWDLNGAVIIRSGPLNTVDPNWKITNIQN